MTSTKMLRHINTLRCLGALRNGIPLSRSDIARELGMTRATVGNAIRPLVAAKLVVELSDREDAAGSSGRPGILLSLNPAGAYFIGIDITTTGVSAVLIDFCIQIAARTALPIGKEYRNAPDVAALLAELLRGLLKGTKVSEEQVRGLCISVPGIVDKLGCVVSAPGLEWNDVDLRELLPKRIKARWPVQVCNDTVALASAVRAEAANSDMNDVLLLLLSEGIGGAHIRQGRIVEGANGFAGEVGHMVLSANAGLATSATFEALAGYRRFLPFLPAGEPIAEGLLALSRIDKPDRQFKRALEEWADVLAVGLLNLIHILDPQRIVLGGPLAALYPRVEARVRVALERHLVHGFKVPSITVASAAADIAAFGAATMVRETLFTMPEITHSKMK